MPSMMFEASKSSFCVAGGSAGLVAGKTRRNAFQKAPLDTPQTDAPAQLARGSTWGGDADRVAARCMSQGVPEEGEKPMDTESWKQWVETGRRQKDTFFASHPQSPLPGEKRHSFRGLDYWPPDPAYRFELDLHEHDEKQVIQVADTKGQNRSLLRWGEFRFTIGDQECVLQAYKSDSREERLFIPFRDPTSGTESYGAGRYLDLSPDTHLSDDGKWILDLNDAYNPWCAYSEDYACPFVPPENRLTAPVRAGEKSYPPSQDEKNR